MSMFVTSKLELDLKKAKTIKDCWEVWLRAEVSTSEEIKSILKMEAVAVKESELAKSPLDCLSTIRALKKYCRSSTGCSYCKRRNFWRDQRHQQMHRKIKQVDTPHFL